MQDNQKKITTLLVVGIIVVLMGVIVINSQSSPQQTTGSTESISGVTNESGDQTAETPISEEGIVIYYGITCPYCKDVDEWIEQEQAEQLLEIEQKEVYENRDNANELTQVAVSCGYDTQRGVGVPFMYAEGQCYSGKFEIIDYLEKRLELTQFGSQEENTPESEVPAEEGLELDQEPASKQVEGELEVIKE